MKYLPQLPSSSGSFLSIVIRYSDRGNFCSIQFQPFWLPQLPVTGEQARSSNKKLMAGVIFVTLANKYWTMYSPQLLPSNGGFLSINI